MPAPFIRCTVALLICLAACSGPEQKKMDFYAKGKRLLEQGDLVKASLELKNAVQIDPEFADAHYQLGLLEWRRGDYARALDCFTKAAGASPGHLDAQVMLGRLYLLTGEHGAARALEKVELVLKADPGHKGALTLRGAILIAGKQWEQAEELLEAITAQGADSPEAYQLLAIARGNRKDHAGTEAALLEGARKNPSSLSVRKSLADLYASRGFVAEAEANIRRMMELDPGNYGYGITLAGLFLEEGRAGEAARLMERIQSEHRNNVNCFADLARLHLGRGEADQAERLLRQGIAAAPEAQRLCLMLGELLAGTDRSGQAVALLEGYLDKEREVGGAQPLEAMNLLARIHVMRGEFAEAERRLAAVHKLDAQNAPAIYLKGCISLLKKDGPRAVSAFRTLAGNRPNDLKTHLLLADAHLLNGEPKLAEESLKQAERLAPDSMEVVRAQARLCVLRKEPRRGEQRMASYLSRHPDDAGALLESGDLCRLAGNQGLAAAQYAAAKRKAPGWPLPYCRLATLLVQQGNLGAAVAEMERARGAAPGEARASLYLAHLYVSAASLRKARALFEELWRRHPGQWEVANDYAAFLADNGTSAADLELARSMARSAARERQDDPCVLDTLGWVEYRGGHYREAAELLERSWGKRPWHQVANYHLGMAYLRVGKKDMARDRLSHALSGGGFPGRGEAVAALESL